MTTPAISTAASSAAAPAKTRWRDRAEWIVFLTGGFGVLSGFSVFFLMLDKADRPGLFLGVLAVASGLSAIFEGLRERIEHGTVEARPWSMARFMLVIVILVVAEIHGMSWEALTTSWASSEFSVIVHTVLGSSMTGSEGLVLDLVVLVGFWVVSGAALSLALLWQLQSATGSLGRRVGRGALHGAMSGAIIAPLGLLAYVLVVWVVRGLYLLCFAQTTWFKNLAELQKATKNVGSLSGTIFKGVFAGLHRGAEWMGPGWGPLLVVALALAVVVVLVRWELHYPAALVGFALAAAVMAPLLLNFDTVLRMLLRAALVWLAPGLVLGAMAPLLKETSEHAKPRVWALVAFASAAVLFVITALRFTSYWWLLGPAALLFGLGLALRRASHAEEYWLPMAVAIGVLVSSVTWGVQSATSFVGVYDQLHHLTTLPSGLNPKTGKPVLSDETKKPPQQPSGQLAPLPGVAVMIGTPATLDQRREGARALLRKIEGLRQERNAQLPDAAPGAVDESATGEATGLRAAIEGTIKRQRELPEQLKKLEGTRKALQSVSERAAVIRTPIGVITLLGVTGTNWLAEIASLNGEITRTRDELLADIKRDIAKLDDDAQHIPLIQNSLAARERDLRETMVRWLELALAGSVGYWTAISLLVGWSMRQRANSGEIR